VQADRKSQSSCSWPSVGCLWRDQPVQLLLRLAFVIHVVNDNALFVSPRVETDPLLQRNALGPFCVDTARDAERGLISSCTSNG
jgi:hypothetical protein